MQLVKIEENEYIEEFNAFRYEDAKMICYDKKYFYENIGEYYAFKYDCLNFLGIRYLTIWRHSLTWQTFGHSKDYYIDALLEYCDQQNIKCNTGRYLQKLPLWELLVRGTSSIKMRLLWYGAGYEFCFCFTLREFIEKYFFNNYIRKFMLDESEHYDFHDRKKIMKFLRKQTQIDAAAFLVEERAELKLFYNN